MAGVLYVVATPIGNLEDISLRALRVLKEVDLIAAEDTRHTGHLLAHYDIRTALVSYHEHNERAQAARLVERLQRGENMALVSDAGTPAISDPGYRLVVEALRAGLRVVSLPGPSAVTAVLSASGLPTDRFVFEGFLPAKKHERETRLETLRAESRTMVFYEAPHRLKESLADMLRIFGNREVVVGREVSKLHEEYLRGTAREIIEQIAAREIKGEITIIVRGASDESSVSEEELKAEIHRLAGEGMGVKQISELLGSRYKVAKRNVYQLAVQLRGSRKKR
ncbi:MAG TPA: 16S rRNA (cytidine(1402)-2'-O)-methyltransferase [Candidatus Binatia bacterium]|nr:16S rRNA (cytidine(1402)-2'-O)-methyltransferase [Candidatus Binatia bacterium]